MLFHRQPGTAQGSRQLSRHLNHDVVLVLTAWWTYRHVGYGLLKERQYTVSLIPTYSHSQQPYRFQGIWLNEHGNNVQVSSVSLRCFCQVLYISYFHQFVLFTYQLTFFAPIVWKWDIRISTLYRGLWWLLGVLSLQWLFWNPVAKILHMAERPWV
jgi:hypothetical protein